MKKLFPFLLFLILLQYTQAQDYILKRNGEEIYGNVTEVSSTEIRYTDTIAAGITRVLNKSEVFMIKFRNGLREVYTQEIPKAETKNETPQPYKNPMGLEGPIINLGSNDFSINGKIYHYPEIKRMLLSLEDPEINKLLVQARMEYIFGNILAYTSIPVGIIGLALTQNGIDYGSTGMTVAGVLVSFLCISQNAANIVFKVDKRQRIDKALAIYNKKVAEMFSAQ